MTNSERTQQHPSLWKWKTLINIRRFDDGSSIMYFEEGGRQVNFIPRNFDEPPKVPKAYLYYWQVERNRPDITTWEQIRQVEKKGA
jgi:hypothetical protein